MNDMRHVCMMRAARALSSFGLACVFVPGVLSAAVSSPYGVCAHITFKEPPARTCATVRSAGFGWVRANFLWGAVERDPGVWDFSKYDNVVSVCEAEGVQLLPILCGSVPWAKPANPMYAEVIARYLTRDDQDDMIASVPDTPWATENGLDMQGLLLAFQDFWRENANMNRAPFEFNEAYPHIVLQAFLQRVLNGGGEIIREMALGKGALDLGVLYHGAKYAVEVKLRYLWDRSPEKALEQVRRYTDHLGVGEGWLVVLDPDMAKPWDEKIAREDRTVDGRPIHVFYC